MLFDLIFGVVNQIFRRTATLFDDPICRLDSIFDRVSDSFLHIFHFGSKLSRGGADICDFIEYFSFHCYSPLIYAFDARIQSKTDAK